MKEIKRALLKLSGGALAGKNGDTFDFDRLDKVAKQIIDIANTLSL